MAQCEGTTKSGARCRRQAGTDSSFCASHGRQDDHGEQHAEEPEATRAAGEPSATARQKHPLTGAAVVGLVALGLLALRRVIRLF